jgi:Domain of unknown function (DUF4386)
MTSNKTAARVAGLLYLLNGALAPFSLLYIPSTFVVAGDASATANRIRASELLFRSGIVDELISATIFIFVGLAFYHFLKGVNKKQALLLLTLVLVSVPISFLNELNRIAALTLSRGAGFLAVFDQRQVDALVMAFLNLHGSGLLLVQIFWGLWLFPFGVLVFKSGFLPRTLGVLLIIAGVAYVASSFTSLLFPAHGHAVFMLAGLFGGIGEGATILWLLIMGAKDRPLVEPST